MLTIGHSRVSCLNPQALASDDDEKGDETSDAKEGDETGAKRRRSFAAGALGSSTKFAARLIRGKNVRRSRDGARALLRKVFDAVDEDGSGTVERRELLLAMARRDLPRKQLFFGSSGAAWAQHSYGPGARITHFCAMLCGSIDRRTAGFAPRSRAACPNCCR